LGLQPTGSKDPFALRRQANGIVRMIAEKKLPLGLSQMFADAREIYRGSAPEGKFSGEADYTNSLRTFFRERLEFFLRDMLGFKYDVVNAVLAAASDDVVDAVARAEAVTKVRPSADFESITVAFKRIKNILRQAKENGVEAYPPELFGWFNLDRDGNATVAPPGKLPQKMKLDRAEVDLHLAREEASAIVGELTRKKEFEQALVEISKLRPLVDTFFDKVMVMVDDEVVRGVRLMMLGLLVSQFSTIADFSEIVTEGKESTQSSK